MCSGNRFNFPVLPLSSHSFCHYHHIRLVNPIIHRNGKSLAFNRVYKRIKELFWSSRDHRIEDNLTPVRQDTGNVSPKNIVIEFFRYFVVDEEVDDNEPISLLFFPHIPIGIGTDNLSIGIGIESKITPSYLYDNRINIHRHKPICETEIIPHDINHRTSAEPKQEDIFIRSEHYLAEGEPHNPM